MRRMCDRTEFITDFRVFWTLKFFHHHLHTDYIFSQSLDILEHATVPCLHVLSDALISVLPH